MDRKPSGGFTLLELLVAMAVTGILLGVGVPSFVEVMKNARLSTQHNDLLQSLYLARSEAIKGTADVVVCARSTDTTCSTNPNDWKNGWIVFAEVGGTTDFTQAQVDTTDDQILRVSPPISGDNYIVAVGSSDGSVGGASNRYFIRYAGNGLTNWENGTFELCDENDGANRARALNVVATGDARRARATTGADHIPLDVFGTAIDCN